MPIHQLDIWDHKFHLGTEKCGVKYQTKSLGLIVDNECSFKQHTDSKKSTLPEQVERTEISLHRQMGSIETHPYSYVQNIDPTGLTIQHSCMGESKHH